MKYLSTLLPLLTLGLASAAEIFGGNTVAPDPEKARTLNVTVGVNFANSVPELGVRAVNGVPTQINLHMTNYEEGDVGVEFIGGSLWNAEKGAAIKNLTSLKVGLTLGKDQQVFSSSFPSSFG